MKKQFLLIYILIIFISACSISKKNPEIRWSNPSLQGNGLMAVSNINYKYYAVGEAGTILSNRIFRGPEPRWRQAFDSKITNVWLSDIWTGDNTIFIAGYNGTIIEIKNEDIFTTHNTNITNDLNAIWGYSSNSVFAVGDRGTIIHYDGTSWKIMDSGTNNLLFDIWGSSNNNVYASGGRGTLLHWDGVKWETINIADADIHITKLWGNGSNNIYAGGTGGKLFHFDGKTWQTIPLPADRLVKDIEGWYRKNIFVLLEPNIIAMYDGEKWIQEKAGGDNVILRDMDIENGRITIVGDGGTIISKFVLNIEEGDKRAWFNSNKGSIADITKIIKLTDHDFYAAGDNILKYQKEGGWAEETNPLSGKIRSLYKKGEDIVAAGDGGEIAILKNSKWQKYPNADFDIYGISEGKKRLYIIGKEGHLAYYDEKGNKWESVDTKTDKDLKGIYADAKGELYIVGSSGTILRVGENGVSAIPFSIEEDLYDIDGDGKDIYISGAFGTLLRHTKDAWEKIDTNVQAVLRSVVVMKDKIVAGGDSGEIIVKDRYGLKDLSNITSNTIRDIVIKDNKSVFFAGDNGMILEMGW